MSMCVCVFGLSYCSNVFFYSLSLSHTQHKQIRKKRKEMESPSTVIIVGGYRMSLESVGTISTGDIPQHITELVGLYRLGYSLSSSASTITAL